MKNTQHTTLNIQHSVHQGFGLVEMVVGAAVLSVSLFAVSGFFQTTLIASRATQSVIQGDYLMEEGIEATKLFRDVSYSNSLGKMSTTTTYYLLWNGTKWATTTAYTIIDNKYVRTLTVADVKRDSISNDISATGNYDSNTKLVTIAVAWWGQMSTTTRSIQTYIMNIFNN